MNYTADCPKCFNEFPVAGPTTAEAGLTCPTCSHAFTPEKIHKVETLTEIDPFQKIEESAQLKERKRYEELLEDAHNCFILAIALIVLTVLLIIIALNNPDHELAWLSAGSLSLTLALVAFFISQTLHIRAALQKLYLKK